VVDMVVAGVLSVVSVVSLTDMLVAGKAMDLEDGMMEYDLPRYVGGTLVHH